jgi:hypothetical protein
LERNVSDLDAFFARYSERYMASDVETISSMYEAPLLAVREGRAIHLADGTAVREHFSEVMAAYRRSGAVRADIASLDSMPLGKSSLVATIRWHVHDATGALIKDFRTSYQLLRAGGGWRILTYTNHDD